MEDFVPEKHYINRSNWLRAAVLGANDGIISISSVAIGVASAQSGRNEVVLATLAALVAGALSMAAGEYVSVSSQTDIEKADIKREQEELEKYPESELHELAKIYQSRGLDEELSLKVAEKLHAADALAAHTRDELGISEMTQANPIQAALASMGAFLVGGVLPLLVSIFAPLNHMPYYQYVAAIFFLAILGYISAHTGGARKRNAVLRLIFWGTLAMVISAVIGYIFGVQTA